MSSLRTRPVAEAAPSYRPELLRTFDPPEPDEADQIRDRQSVVIFDTLLSGPFGGWFDVGGPNEDGGLVTFHVEDEISGQLLDDDSREIHLTIRQRLYVIDGDKEACRNAAKALRHFAEDLCIAATAIEEAEYQDALCRLKRRG